MSAKPARRGNGSRRDSSYTGPERRQAVPHLPREEFTEFAGGIRNHLARQDEAMAAQGKTLARLDVAMFAPDENNEHGAPGVFVVMPRVNNQFNVVGSWIRAFKKFSKYIVVPTGTAIAAIAGGWQGAKMMGWL